MKYRRSSEKRNFGEEKNSTTTLNKVEAEFNEILNYVESVDDEALVSDEKYWKVTPLLGPPLLVCMRDRVWFDKGGSPG